MAASDLDVLVEACLTGRDRPFAVRELRGRLRELVGPGAAARTEVRALDHFLDAVLAGDIANADRARQVLATAVGELQRADRGTVQALRADGRPLSDRMVDVVEQLDLLASGIDDVPGAESPADAIEDRGKRPQAPPVLTERDDGSRVELGRFNEADTPAVPFAGALPATVAEIVAALGEGIAEAQRELGSLAAVSPGDDVQQVRRTVENLAAILRALERQKCALEAWAAESAALLGSELG